MKIDHICFAVKDLTEGINYWVNSFGYYQMTSIIINNLQKVKVVFLCNDESLLVKLIEPLHGNLSLQNFVNRVEVSIIHVSDVLLRTKSKD